MLARAQLGIHRHPDEESNTLPPDQSISLGTDLDERSAGARQTIWVDVEDLFQYFLANFRPSGIQRLAFEIMLRLPDRAAGWPGAPRIAFVRHTPGMQSLAEIPFDDVSALFDANHRPTPPSRALAPHHARLLRLPRFESPQLRAHATLALDALHPAIREPLLAAGFHQKRAVRYAKAALITALITAMITARAAARAWRGATRAAPPTETAELMPGFHGRPGDVFLVLGAPWNHPGYERLLHSLQADRGLRAAILLYDLIPVRRPEWCAAEVVGSFVPWLSRSLPHFDHLMAISRATAEDVTAFASEIGMTLHAPVRAVPIGTSFGLTAATSQPDAPANKGLPVPGSYVLFVSTLEARKNHALLFRIWCRLLDELPRDQVPTLVFAGRIGWMVADLLQQLENTQWLGGKVRMMREATDAELLALYRGCLFTVFPSHFEGWGLPVTESLALGCPCLASDRTSLPEAGGALARYFDPDEFDDAYHSVRRVIDDPDGLRAWRDQVSRDFRPVSWDTTADAILDACLQTQPHRSAR